MVHPENFAMELPSTRLTILSLLHSRMMTGPCMRQNSGSVSEISEVNCARIVKLQSPGCSDIVPLE
jgi:hypothetical protein